MPRGQHIYEGCSVRNVKVTPSQNCLESPKTPFKNIRTSQCQLHQKPELKTENVLRIAVILIKLFLF